MLLGKIGYSFAAPETGTDDLLPMLADIILGKSDKATYLIGGGIPMSDGIYDTEEMGEYCKHESSAGQFTSVLIHLFGQLGMPIHHVVVRYRPHDK